MNRGLLHEREVLHAGTGVEENDDWVVRDPHRQDLAGGGALLDDEIVGANVDEGAAALVRRAREHEAARAGLRL